MTREPVVRVRHVNHAYGQRDSRKQVLFDNSLDLYPGEIILMTGPSGSGKTTLLTLIGALRSVQEGSLVTLGRELCGMAMSERVALRREIGFIFQGHNLFDSLTAAENVNLAIELYRVGRAKRDRMAAEMLERLGMGHRLGHKPQALSGGQKQRVAIARALVNKPKLILADEPTAALDKDSGRQVVDLLRSLAANECATILMVTHDSRILDVADRIVNMVDGHISSDVAVHETVTVCDLLVRCPLFAQQPAAMLAELAQLTSRAEFPAGSTVFRQGDPGDSFYIIISGRVEVQMTRDGLTSTVATLGPGDFFGEVALLTEEPRNATLVVLESMNTLTLQRDYFNAAIRRSRTLEEQLREVLYQRR